MVGASIVPVGRGRGAVIVGGRMSGESEWAGIEGCRSGD